MLTVTRLYRLQTGRLSNRLCVVSGPQLPSANAQSVANLVLDFLTEGEQFANAFFDTETKMKIAQALSDFGVEYIELTSPAASEQSRADCERICKMGLKSKILTHIRCHMDDARIAVETGQFASDFRCSTLGAEC